jgi:bacteriorhodopsin
MIGGKEVFVTRYIDWVITTPLLLMSLLLIALPALKSFGEVRQRIGLIGTIVFADVIMIVTGLLANVTSSTDSKRFWFLISCLGFFAVLYYMFTVVRKSAQSLGATVGRNYTTLLTFLTILWFFYPIVWLLGASGNNTIGLDAEVALYTILDLLAKAVFGILLVMMVREMKKLDS